MRGMNVVALTGNVASIDFDKTRSRGDDVCSFTLAVQKSKEIVTWARVNVFGTNLVEICRERLNKGDPVAVEGELMNRKVAGDGESFLTEIRAKDIKFIF